MKIRVLLPLILSIWGCTTESKNEAGTDFEALARTWKADSDSISGLDISGICCGEGPSLSGSVTLSGATLALQPQSRVTRYTVVKPDSGAKPVYLFEVYLALEARPMGGLCGLDGFVLADSGQNEFSTPAIGSVYSLKLASWVQDSSGCKSTGDSLEFVSG